MMQCQKCRYMLPKSDEHDDLCVAEPTPIRRSRYMPACRYFSCPHDFNHRGECHKCGAKSL